MFKLKILVSYLFDILLEQHSSSYNPFIKLYLSQGQLKLVATNAVYSYGNLYYNFRDCFTLLKINQKQINSVLLLGLGTGSVIQLLEQRFNLNARFTAVEIDPLIIELFNKYKDKIVKSDCKLIVEDAFEYMRSNHIKYDLICMDIFVDRAVPEEFESIEFLEYLKSALSETGILIYNRINYNGLDQDKNELFYNRFQTVLPHAQLVKLEFNWMLVSSSVTQ